MDEWVTQLAEEYTSPDTPKKEENTKLSVLLATPDVDIDKMMRLLSTNGFHVVDIRVENTKDDKLPDLQAGMRVVTKTATQVGSDILIKTPTTLYKVAHAVLPAGYVGDVLSIDKNNATVRFCANISVSGRDASGYTDNLAYFVDTLDIPVKDLNILG